MQVVCFMLVCLHYRPGSIRRIRWTGGMFAVYGTMGLRLIWFLLGLMLVCSHHKVGNFMSDPRVHATIGLGSHMCQLCFHVSMFTMLRGNLCSLDPFYELGVFLVFTTPWGWVSNVFSLVYVNMFTLQNGKHKFRSWAQPKMQSRAYAVMWITCVLLESPKYFLNGFGLKWKHPKQVYNGREVET
jgi:hypothetical protein